MRIRPTASWLCCFAMTALLTTAASAQTPGVQVRDEIARNHFATGTRYFEIGQYEDAAREFRRAHDLAQQPEILFNLARALESAGRLDPAAQTYEAFLAAGSPGVERSIVEARLATVRARIASVQSEAEPVALPAAGAPAPTIVARGEVAQRPATPGRAEHRRSLISEIGPFVFLGVGGVLGGLAAWQGLAANDDIGRLHMANDGNVAWSASLTDARSRASGEVTAAWVLGISGGVVAVTGLLWLLLRGPGERREVPVRAQLELTAGAGAFTIGGAL